MEYVRRYDVVVVGGGFSGCGAALAAAEEGRSVLLLEASNALGGAANVNLVNPFMPFYSKVDGETQLYSQGIFQRITDEMAQMGAFLGKKTVLDNKAFNEEILKLLLNRMMERAGVTLLFHAYLCGADYSEGKLRSVTVATKSGNLDFEADCFVDATGDADLAALAGCPFRLGRSSDGLCQPMTLCFRLANVDVEKFKEEKPLINPLYNKWQEEGRIKNIRENVLVFHYPVDGILHFNTTRVVRLDPTNVFDVTRAEIEAREQVFEMVEFLRENFECFRNSELISTAASIGVRESRMIDGAYLLTEEDLKACVRFEDSIALGNYDIDIHNPSGSGTSHYYFAPGTYYTIPYRCLVPKGITNLLVTGRCISVTHEAQASIRIMPIVCCLGEAAGCAAAMISESGCDAEAVDHTELRRRLSRRGAAI